MIEWLVNILLLGIIYLWRITKFILVVFIYTSIAIYFDLDRFNIDTENGTSILWMSFLSLYFLSAYFLYRKLPTWKYPKETEDFATVFWYAFEYSFVIFVSILIGLWLQHFNNNSSIDDYIWYYVTPILCFLTYVDTRTSFTKKLTNGEPWDFESSHT